jgi:hypothetical protein
MTKREQYERTTLQAALMDFAAKLVEAKISRRIAALFPLELKRRKFVVRK